MISPSEAGARSAGLDGVELPAPHDEPRPEPREHRSRGREVGLVGLHGVDVKAPDRQDPTFF